MAFKKFKETMLLVNEQINQIFNFLVSFLKFHRHKKARILFVMQLIGFQCCLGCG